MQAVAFQQLSSAARHVYSILSTLIKNMLMYFLKTCRDEKTQNKSDYQIL